MLDDDGEEEREVCISSILICYKILYYLQHK